MKGFTKRQQEIIQYIKEFISTHRYSPSYREIMRFFGYNSLGTVYKHIQVLKRKGGIKIEDKCSRSLTLALPETIPQELSTILLPFIGHFKAGSPISTFPQARTLEVPKMLVQAPDKTYVLRVLGDSLSEELIGDGDLLLVEARQEANPGETILASIQANETILKRYYPEGQYVRLLSQSPHQNPMIVRQEEVNIQGILVGLLRTYG
jgi:repressor LexA